MKPRRISLAHTFGKKRLHRWRTGRLNGHTERFVEVGWLESGEHYAAVSREDAYVLDTLQDALDWAQQWLSPFAAWTEVPAEFGPDGLPTSEGWTVHGQTWRRVGDSTRE